MAFTRSADGIAKKGKTKGKNLGDSGSNVGIEMGKKVGKGPAGGLSQDKMQASGRGLAKVAANGK